MIVTAFALYELLKKEWALPKPDLKKCGEYLARLKIYLAELAFLVPKREKAATDEQELLLAREVLEIGAYWSIRVRDIPSFERCISQLKTYYNDFSSALPESARKYPLLGLNLLRLLAQNRISEFHTELELLLLNDAQTPPVSSTAQKASTTKQPAQSSFQTISENVYIRHPMQIEQCLMEGSYNKVWHSRQNVPSEEYTFFIDILMSTIRDEIASCSEKAYESLPLADAATLLYFKTPEEVTAFAQERGWTINPTTRKITFGADANSTAMVTGTATHDIPADNVIRQTLEYARELERIV
ncbi:COP9 signalosome [Phlyctochytrium arcticum]|nr:COP9 signalosome [Phlyctochytrium arcticum]